MNEVKTGLQKTPSVATTILHAFSISSSVTFSTTLAELISCFFGGLPRGWIGGCHCFVVEAQQTVLQLSELNLLHENTSF
jgi:hypothetical protein